MNVHAERRERLKARFVKHGLDSLDDHDVLELLLFYTLSRQDTNLIAHRLLSAFGNLAGVLDASKEALMSVEGVEEDAACLIRLIPQVARRYLIRKTESTTILSNSTAAAQYLIPRFFNGCNEVVYMLCLDPAMRLLDCSILNQGTAGSAGISIRQIIHRALNQNAFGVILAHNHVSGLAQPSRDDQVATQCIRDALATVEVMLIDHIIVAGETFVSMADSGFLTSGP